MAATSAVAGLTLTARPSIAPLAGEASAARETSFQPRSLHETQSELLLAARSNSPYARARLVESFMPLIGGIARIYAHVPTIDRAELMQEGVVGVLRALERYDPELGTPFWAYASWWVRQAMQQVVAELSRPVVLSDRALRQLAHVRYAWRAFVRAHAREPTLQELATASELSLEQLGSLTVAERQPRALEEQIDDAANRGATFGDTLCDPRAEEAYEEVGERIGAAEVPRLLRQLSERERRVIEARYGIERQELTLRELGQAMGISAERVRQIEQSALEKMRAGYSLPPELPSVPSQPTGAPSPFNDAARVLSERTRRSSRRSSSPRRRGVAPEALRGRATCEPPVLGKGSPVTS